MAVLWTSRSDRVENMLKGNLERTNDHHQTSGKLVV